MSELFVELFSEEIPAKLQINARNELKKNIKNFFIDNQIKFNINSLHENFYGDGYSASKIVRKITEFLI